MLRYICSLPNPGLKGSPHELFYPDDESGAALARAFIARENGQPGRGIYYCIGKLKDGATSRCKETVGELDAIIADLDLKNIAQSREEVLACLQGLLLPPYEIRDSGFGLHPVWKLKEPLADNAGLTEAETVMKQLVELLAGDPAPTHRAALLRQPETDNTKEPPARRCRVIWQSGKECDVSEFADMFDMYGGRPLLTRKEKPKSNGSTHQGGDAQSGPVDVEALLASMDRGNCNDRHKSIIPALIWRAWHPDKVLDYLLEPTLKVWGGDKEQQAATILGRIKSTVKNLFMAEYDPASGEIPRWLAEEFHGDWAAALAQGKRPCLSRNGRGWHIRAYGGDEGEAKEDGGEAGGEGARHNGNGRRRADKRPHLKDVTLSWWKPIDPATFPAREWLYGRHYQRQSVGLTTAPGGSGKTSLDLLDAVAMATCRNLTGVQPEQRLRVWYHNAEDNQLEIERRVLAICQRFDIDQAELGGWLVVTTCEQFDLKVANGFNDLKLDEAILEAMATKIQALEIDVAVFDPLINLHTTDEYNNVKMAQVLGALRSVAQAENCAIEVAQHTRKHPAGMTGDYTGADGRGAGSVRDAARSQRVLNVMGKDEAEKHHIAEHERRLYVRVDIDKANNSPPQAAAWLHIANVTLPNSDEVGVVEPWVYPGAAGPDDPARAAAEVQADTLFMVLLHEFTLQGREVSHSPKSTNYAAKLFAEDPAAIEAKTGTVALKAAMARLFKADRVAATNTGAGHHRRSVLRAK